MNTLRFISQGNTAKSINFFDLAKLILSLSLEFSKNQTLLYRPTVGLGVYNEACILFFF